MSTLNRHLDALEPSVGMLKVLTGRGIYQNTFEVPIGFAKIDSIASSEIIHQLHQDDNLY